MRRPEHRYHREEGPPGGERPHRGGGRRHGESRGAKTFRRGRAIEFLERMRSRRNTLKKQLATPELQTINPVLVGELKAVETLIDEFTQLFGIQEEEVQQENALEEGSGQPEQENE